jgi:hypothetical protein
MKELVVFWIPLVFGRKFYFRNIILNDFGNTVKELAISWFFGFHPSLKCSWLIL